MRTGDGGLKAERESDEEENGKQEALFRHFSERGRDRESAAGRKSGGLGILKRMRKRKEEQMYFCWRYYQVHVAFSTITMGVGSDTKG